MHVCYRIVYGIPCQVLFQFLQLVFCLPDRHQYGELDKDRTQNRICLKVCIKSMPVRRYHGILDSLIDRIRMVPVASTKFHKLPALITYNQCCGSGSGSGNFLKDPDPDPE
jgi:hypothetical protein